MANTKKVFSHRSITLDPLRTSWKSLLKRINGSCFRVLGRGSVEAKLLSPHATAARTRHLTPRGAAQRREKEVAYYFNGLSAFGKNVRQSAVAAAVMFTSKTKLNVIASILRSV